MRFGVAVRSMHRVFGFLLLAALTGSLAFAAGKSEAAEKDDQVVTIYNLDIKEGMADQFESALATHVAWRKQHDDPWTWHVYQHVNGPKLGHYTIRSGTHGWSDIDEYQEFSAKASDHFSKTVGPFVENMHSVIARMNTEVAHEPKKPTDYKLVELTEMNVKPGKMEQFEQSVAKFHKAAREAERPGYYSLAMAAVGAQGQTVYMTEPRKRWADFQPPEETFAAVLERQYGKQEAQTLLQEFSGSIENTTSYVLELRPELSIVE